ncbi:unannotated protein [freshwater metagenome]|uniref:Unannotated protein n=1 Tax=freshwater metagenome TaxID=449393 RepID=A0A6J7DIG1_9ZZZZ
MDAGTDGADANADVPDGLGPAFEERQDLLGTRIGGEIQVRITVEAAEHRIADRAADQGNREAGVMEAIPERGKQACHGRKLVEDVVFMDDRHPLSVITPTRGLSCGHGDQ